MQLIRHKESVIVNLAQTTHIETSQTATQYHIVFYHHFSYIQESYKDVTENFHETIWYFDLKDERDTVYATICSKYVDTL